MKRGVDSEKWAFKEALKRRSQIKGWLVAVLAAVVFAIAPMYYGIFATLNWVVCADFLPSPSEVRACVCWH